MVSSNKGPQKKGREKCNEQKQRTARKRKKEKKNLVSNNFKLKI